MMKNKFLIVTFLLIFSHCFLRAQNAFYDSKRITDSMQKGKTDAVLSILLNYVDEGKAFPWERLSRKYPDLVKPFQEIANENSRLALKALLADSINLNRKISKEMDSEVMKKFNAELQQYLKLKSSHATYSQLKDKLLSYLEKSKNDTTRYYDTLRIDLMNQLKKETLYDTLYKQEIDKLTYSNANPDSIVFSYDTLNFVWLKHLSSKSLESEISMDEKFNVLLKLFKNESVFTTLLPKDELENFRSSKPLFSGSILPDEKIRRETSFNEASGRQVATFSLPSQAEMIDAMAIYLAKRVKQEAAITFMEKLGTHMRDQSILTNLFPSTLQLLNHQDAYSKPNFGTSWQIALSEDFIHIPENLSKCLPVRFSAIEPYLMDGVQIGRLVQQNYSFTEGVNRLYNESLLKVPALRNANNMLYIMNHEFYDNSDNSRYWINARMIQNMSPKQIEWLYVLLDIRYGEALNKVMSERWKGKQVWDQTYFTEKIYPLRNWISRILVQLNHFENQLQGISKSTNSTGQKLAGYWKFQHDLMEVVIDTNFLQLPAKTDKYLTYTRGLFTLYSAIESRNYPLLVDELLSIFSMLELDQRINLRDVLFNKQFISWMNKMDDPTRDHSKLLLRTMNDHYDQLAHMDQIKDLIGMYHRLIATVKQNEKLPILSESLNQDQFQKKLTEALSGNYSTNVDSLLFIPEFNKKSKNNSRLKAPYQTLLDSMNLIYERLEWYKQDIEKGRIAYRSMDSIIKLYKVNKNKLSRIKGEAQERFVAEKLFTFEAPIYGHFLNRVQNQSQYKKILTTLSFLSDVMQSNNSQSLSKVIESYALPPSSYKIKRHSRFAINLDALVGGYFGLEYIKSLQGNPKMTAVGGLSAPIGLSLSWGKRSTVAGKRQSQLEEGEFGFVNKHGHFKALKGYNLSVLFSVIDIGAAVSYRITGNTEGGLPSDAKWSQVFSPGITALMGIKGMPLCIGSGFRFTPNLRTFQSGLKRNALRFDVGLYFDLPLLNVYFK